MKNGDILFCFAQNAWVDLDSVGMELVKIEKSEHKVKMSFVTKTLKLLKSWLESFEFKKYFLNFVMNFFFIIYFNFACNSRPSTIT